jgi:hypothetical protein
MLVWAWWLCEDHKQRGQMVARTVAFHHGEIVPEGVEFEVTDIRQ